MREVSEETGPGPAAADPHGAAALLLVESLIHGLVSKSVLSVNEAIDVMEVALDAYNAVAADPRHPPSRTPDTRRLLSAMITSLMMDAGD